MLYKLFLCSCHFNKHKDLTQCLYCGKVFSTSSFCNPHAQIYPGKNCNKYIHLSIVPSLQEFLLPWCSKEFTLGGKRIHSGDRLYMYDHVKNLLPTAFPTILNNFFHWWEPLFRINVEKYSKCLEWMNLKCVCPLIFSSVFQNFCVLSLCWSPLWSHSEKK